MVYRRATISNCPLFYRKQSPINKLLESTVLTDAFILFSDVLQELDDAYERYRRETDPQQRRRLQLAIQRALIRSQELGDEKIQIAGQMVSDLCLVLLTI